jgi:acetolactate synthase-1/2/3 large subunit
MATSGGGSLNLVAGLGESFASSVPVLALIGQPPTTLDGRGAFQDTSGCRGALDAEALFSEVSLFCRRIVRPDDIRTALPEALAAARVGGPAVLLLPKDIQQAHVDSGSPVAVNLPRRCRHGDLDEIACALQRAAGPVAIIAGEQIAMDDARDELEALRTTLQACVATAPEAKDATCATTSLGVTGVMGHPGVAEAIQISAVCLLVGTRLAATAGAGLHAALSDVTTLSLGSAPPYVPSTHAHSDDLRVSLPQLTHALTSRGQHDRAEPNTLPRNDLTPPVYEGSGVRYRDAMGVLDAALPDGVDIVVDAGNAGAAAIHYLPSRRDGRFVVALGMGGMGYSFGAAIGIAFARRRRTVIIAGDGSFYMHGLELHTAIEYQLPVTLVLFNNNAHAMCVTREQIFYDGRYSYNRFRPSKIGRGLAAMFPSLTSAEVSELDDLPAALSAALEAAGPSVVSIDCSADEIPPFAPFLNARQPAPTHHEEKKNVASRA